MFARDDEELAALIRAAPASGLLARGLGRSYGDAAQNEDGLILGLFQPDRKPLVVGDTVTASAGTSFSQLLHATIPLGLMPPVLAGTRHVSVGGAVAADIHGKNHHVDGSIGRWLRSVVLFDGLGDRHVVSAETDSDVFWATVGGMGLTGVVTEASMRLLPIDTSYLRVRTRRIRDFASLLSTMRDGSAARYQVAWVDGLARGRAIVEDGEPARIRDLPVAARRQPLHYRPHTRAVAPRLSISPLHPRLVRAFNEFWWRRARDGERIVSLSRFFHPLDAVAQWPRLYGSGGFLQYQIVVPDGAEQVLERFVTALPAAGLAPFLVVLKRFGPGNAAPMSFPFAGWTIAADFPAGQPALAAALDALDAETAAVGGRVYLAKDARLRPAVLAQMYSQLPLWRKVRADLDPFGRFQSDLGRRLSVHG